MEDNTTFSLVDRVARSKSAVVQKVASGSVLSAHLGCWTLPLRKAAQGSRGLPASAFWGSRTKFGTLLCVIRRPYIDAEFDFCFVVQSETDNG
jgi:hypothetical protein